MTGITDSEEEAMGRADLVPFLLEDRIREVRLPVHQRFRALFIDGTVAYGCRHAWCLLSDFHRMQAKHLAVLPWALYHWLSQAATALCCMYRGFSRL